MSLFGTNVGGNSSVSNNIKVPNLTSTPNISDRFSASKQIGLNEKPFEMPISGPSAYARNRADVRVSSYQPNTKPPSTSYTPSSIAKTLSNIEQQASAGLLSAGIFTSVMSVANPIGLAAGIGASVIGTAGQIINPLIAPTVDKFVNVFSSA